MLAAEMSNLVTKHYIWREDVNFPQQSLDAISAREPSLLICLAGPSLLPGYLIVAVKDIGGEIGEMGSSKACTDNQ